jgi:ribosomal protein S18 acetylase RimI-like enzyme
MYAAPLTPILGIMTVLSSTVVVRPMGRDDVPGLAALLRQLDEESTFLAWEPGERDLDDVRTLERRLISTTYDNTCRLVAVDDERLVGFLVAHQGPTRRLRHRADLAMAVLADYQRRGVGSGLLRALTAWAQTRGIVRLELSVRADNSAALCLYRRHGFVEEGVKRGAIRIDGRDVDEVVMGRLHEDI